MDEKETDFEHLMKILEVDITNPANLYYYRRAFDSFSFRGSVNDLFIRKLEAKIIPWYAAWCTPWPIDLLNERPFRGVNFFLVRSRQRGFCPYWWPCSYLIQNKIKVRKGEKGVLAILKKDGESNIEMFYRVDQLEDAALPKIEKPVKPPAEEGMKIVFDYFQEYLKYDRYNPRMADFYDEDHYYYMLFQYYCYSWYCHTYNEALSFNPEVQDKQALIYRLGASMLAAFCRISTFYYYEPEFKERSGWIKLLKGDENIIFDATTAALKMYEPFLQSVEMKKAS
jgi:antirestriction protein ArdC